MKPFTFYDIYYAPIKEMDDKQAGKFFRLICDFLDDKQVTIDAERDEKISPEFELYWDAFKYFSICKRKPDENKARMQNGAKGGKPKKNQNSPRPALCKLREGEEHQRQHHLHDVQTPVPEPSYPRAEV